MFKLSDRSKNRLKGVHPFLIEVILKGISNSPLDFGIPAYGGLRTTKDQRELYAIGRTTELERRPVTYTDGVKKVSNHQMRSDGHGWAFDIYIYENGKAVWNGDKLELVARHLQKWAEAIAKENDEYKGYYLSWGGDWTKFKDYPHFELKKL
jgi:peptidoglycan L-alanyl-D-glutamate endopeptidase CwlK